MTQHQINNLKKLGELYKEGILTKDEFEEQKNKILNETLSSSSDKNKKEDKDDSLQVTRHRENPSYISESNNAPSKPINLDQRKEKVTNSKGISDWFNSNRKKAYYLIATILVLIGTGVFIGLYQHRQNEIALAQQREQERLDSIAEAERLLEIQRQDSIRKDELIRNFTSPDLALFNLHGKVKKIEAIEGNFTLPILIESKILQFDENGKLIGLKDTVAAWMKNSLSKVIVRRNDKGYITKISDKDEYECYNFNWTNNELNSIDGWYWYEVDINYKYDKGFISSIYDKFQSETGLDIIKKEFSNFKIDKYGNWIEREYTMEKYIEEYDDYDSKNNIIKTTGPIKGKDIRRIEYYSAE